jgi:hypothetical protein
LAGAHLLLAHSPDDYVSHARKAVELHKKMHDITVEKDIPDKKNQEAIMAKLLAKAERTLKRAEEDYERLGFYTEEELEEIRKAECQAPDPSDPDEGEDDDGAIVNLDHILAPKDSEDSEEADNEASTQ